MRNFKHYMQIQMVELQEHKWYLSEKAGHDIGENETIFDWVTSGHAKRFNEAYTSHEEQIEREIQTNGLVPILQDKNKLHELLEDDMFVGSRL